MRAFAAALLIALPLSAAPDDPVADFTLPDSGGTKRSLSDYKEAPAVVLIFLGVECPRCNRYADRINAIHADYSPKGVTLLAVNSNAHETNGEIDAHAKRCAFTFPVLIDALQTVADRLKVSMIPTTLVLDKERRIRFRGAVDDNKDAERVRSRHLRDALDAVLAGREPAVASTPTPGCEIQRKAPAAPADPAVTYSNRVAAILNENCVSCHRPGQVAPFSLDSHERAARWAANIRRVTQARTMPPWKPANHGTFRQERVMKEDDLKALAAWAEAGAPAGDLDKAPPPPKFAEGWMLGEPDLVLETPEYELDPTGPDEYRCYVLEPNLTEDVWIQAAETRPGNPAVVHHVIAYVDGSRYSVKLDERDPKPGYRTSGTGPGFLPSGEMGGWAPGNFPYRTPDGVGRPLKKNARIVLEVHYHRNGRREKDRTRIGLHFSKKPVDQPLRWISLARFDLDLPAGDKEIAVKARQTVTESMHLLAIMPHMHLIGRKIKVTAQFPDASTRTLVDVPDWDFNWQDTYLFREPLPIPKGTRLLLEAVYDNSAGNPDNPNHPPKRVSWGEETTDEMCIVFISYTRDREFRPDRRLGVELDGRVVTKVTDGSPASRAGVKPGDLVAGWAGREVDDLDDLRAAMLSAGLDGALRIEREGKTLDLPMSVPR